MPTGGHMEKAEGLGILIALCGLAIALIRAGGAVGRLNGTMETGLASVRKEVEGISARLDRVCSDNARAHERLEKEWVHTDTCKAHREATQKVEEELATQLNKMDNKLDRLIERRV